MKMLLWAALGLGCGAKDADDSGLVGEDGGSSDGGSSDGGSSTGEDADEDGFSVEEGDCDDTDDSVFPGAEEVCGDGVVNDCEGSEAQANQACFEGTARGLGDGLQIAGDPVAEAFGRGLLGAPDLTGDGRPDLLASAGDGEAGAWLFAGPLSDPTMLTDAVARFQPGATARGLGEYGASALPGDVDGDGQADLWLSAHAADGAGAAWLFLGPLTGELMPVATLSGDRADDDLGWHLSGGQAGGQPAVLVGAPGAGTGGQALLFAETAAGSLATADADAVLSSTTADALFGTRVGLGADLDGDGLGDLVVGAPQASPGGELVGAVQVFFAPLSGSVADADADATLAGELRGDEAGGGLCLPGDVDGDGHADLWVGADEHAVSSAGNGSVYLVSGPVSGSVALADSTVRRSGEEYNDHLGWQLSCDQDLDGDGRTELLLGVGADDVGELANAGSAALWFSPHAGAQSIADADLLVVGETAGQILGNTAVLTPDLDGDGWPDLAVGSDTGGEPGIVGVFTGLTGGY